MIVYFFSQAETGKFLSTEIDRPTKESLRPDLCRIITLCASTNQSDDEARTAAKKQPNGRLRSPLLRLSLYTFSGRLAERLIVNAG